MSTFDEERGLDGPTCKQCGMVNCNSTRGCQRRQHNNKFRRTLDENAALRAQLAAMTRERDEARAELASAHHARDDIEECLDISQRARDEARESEAKMRAALDDVYADLAVIRSSSHADAVDACAAHAVSVVEAALSAPAPEPSAQMTRDAKLPLPTGPRPDEKRLAWLMSGMPKVGRSTVDIHVFDELRAEVAALRAEPSERMMRVAEAVREACARIIASRNVENWTPEELANEVRALDLRAIVARFVK